MTIQPVILIGGKGKRLGKDKVFLSFENTLLLERTYRLFKESFKEEPLFIGRGVLPYPYKIIPDSIPGIGPIGGLFTALTYTNKDFIFLAACDMPFINKNLLSYMKNMLNTNVDIYIPYFDNGMIEPLFAFYNRRLISLVKEQIKIEDYKLRSLLNTASVQFLSESEIESIDPDFLTFFNVNTKSDFEKAQELLSDKVR
ncbi:MAG: molybdenum cofactor guanylyltransferase [Caldisericaceae bacterium]|nr:molybdenum cofactor guanylyltransferase [Caldisericaceae bacterium]RLD21012.1 MAG: hypothetical protein DRI33_00555 [Caldisericota bacterium]